MLLAAVDLLVCLCLTVCFSSVELYVKQPFWHLGTGSGPYVHVDNSIKKTYS